jgi:hypothetical protein
VTGKRYLFFLIIHPLPPLEGEEIFIIWQIFPTRCKFIVGGFVTIYRGEEGLIDDRELLRVVYRFAGETAEPGEMLTCAMKQEK